MNTGFLVSSLSRQAGGLHDGVRRLAQSMKAAVAGEIHVLAMIDEHTASDVSAWSPVKTQVYPVHGPRAFGYAPRLKKALFALDLDILQLHGLWMYPTVAALAWHRRTGRPFLVNPHGMLDEWAVKNSRWKKRIAGWSYENASLRQAACIRALCASEAKSIRAYGLRNPVCVIPYGIDLPAACPACMPPWAGRIESGKKVLLYLGRLHPKKGLLNLLRAWAEVRNLAWPEAGSWELAIAGWDQNGHEAELKTLARELGLVRNVHFLGPQFGETKASAYHHADAFVLPSFSEGLPMVILEAWAHGRPALMTPACNLPEGFRAEAAIPIETGVHNIVGGLEVLFSMNQQERRAMGARGRELVAARFTWLASAAAMGAVQEWILDSGPRPSCVLSE
jgi:poly(glycerol-phosphate) alpha-glucosyltransferase